MEALLEKLSKKGKNVKIVAEGEDKVQKEQAEKQKMEMAQL